MARSVNHRLRCEHLAGRAVPADVGCTAAAAEGAPAAEGDVIPADEAFAGADIESGVLCGHRVEMDGEGSVVTPPEPCRPADPVVPDAEAVDIPSLPAEFNF